MHRHIRVCLVCGRTACPCGHASINASSNSGVLRIEGAVVKRYQCWVALFLFTLASHAAPDVLCEAGTSRVLFVGDSTKRADLAGNPNVLLNPPSLASLGPVTPAIWRCVGSSPNWTDVRLATAPENAAAAAADATAALAAHKAESKAEFDGDPGEGKRCMAKVLLDEINIIRASYPIPITGITRTSNTATATTKWAHGFTGTFTVTVVGTTLAAYNITATATVASSTTFTYPVAGSPVTPAVGQNIMAYPTNSAFAPRTLAQAKTAIQACVDAGTVVE